MSFLSNIFSNGGYENMDEYLEEMHEREKEFDNEEDYLESLKQDDSYHFSMPFEYYEGADDEDGSTGYMEVDVDWSYSEHGYKISYYIPDEYVINTDYNGDAEEIYRCIIESKVIDALISKEIPNEAICS